MNIARVVASRSNCIKRKVGSVIALDRRIISTGYNGTPRGIRNCNEGGCPRCAGAAESGTRLDECLCSHAEENAITQSAYHGVSVRGGTVYTTFCPCLICTKMIINAGLGEVVYDAHFPLGDVSVALFREAGIKVAPARLTSRARMSGERRELEGEPDRFADVAPATQRRGASRLGAARSAR